MSTTATAAKSVVIDVFHLASGLRAGAEQLRSTAKALRRLADTDTNPETAASHRRLAEHLERQGAKSHDAAVAFENLRDLTLDGITLTITQRETK